MRSTTFTPSPSPWNRMRAGRSWCCVRVTTWPWPTHRLSTGPAYEPKLAELAVLARSSNFRPLRIFRDRMRPPMV